jgi:hypothetical protein
MRPSGLHLIDQKERSQQFGLLDGTSYSLNVILRNNYYEV